MRCALLAVVLAAALAVGQSRRPSFAPGLELKAMPKARAEPNLSAALLRTRGGEAVEAATSAAGPVASGILGRFASLDLFTTKILLAAGLAMLNVLCWAVPLRANAFSGNAEALSFANCFSGGIFLALSLGHLIPEAIEEMHSAGSPASLALWFALAGYLAVFLVDKVAFDTHAMLGDDHGASDADAVLASHAPQATKGPGAIGAVVLLAALCVHSIFETLALGVSSSKTAATLLSASIGLHQPAESLALLVALLKSGLSRSSIVKLLCIFTAMQPLGCALGLVARGLDVPMLDSALAAVAAGTFIYVGCNEVVAEEFEGGTTSERWKKFGSFLGGVGSIVLMTLVTEKWHAH